MRFAYHPSMPAPDQYLPLARAAEEMGFDSFTLPDSICYPKLSDAKYPYNDDGSRDFLDGVPFIEVFIAMAAVAAATTRLRITTSVVKLPIRQPAIVAKQLSSLAVLSNNRIALGVGLSPWPEDYEVCQIPYEKRGKRMDEMVEVIRGLMGGDYFSFAGEIYQIPPIKLCPVPSKPVPIWIGGHTDAALKRAARIGDGWVAAGATFDELHGYIRRLDTLRAEYGREKEPFEVQGMGAEAFTPDGIKRLEDIGVDEVVIAFRNVYAKEPDTSLETKLAQMREYADNVIAKVR